MRVMKKIALLSVVLLFAFLFLVSNVSAVVYMNPGKNEVKIDSLRCTLNTPIVVSDDISFIPTSLLALEGGLEVRTVEGWQQFFNEFGDVVLKVKDGNNKVVVNGREVSLSKPPFIKNDNLMVPAKHVAEEMGFKVVWDQDAKNGFKLSIENPTKKLNWTDKMLRAIGTETFFFICLGLVIFFAVAFFVLTPLRRKWWEKQ